MSCRHCSARSVVFFDVGETLINEARLWDAWAVYLGFPAGEFRSALVKVIASGEHHQKVFERFRPGFDLVSARQNVRVTATSMSSMRATSTRMRCRVCRGCGNWAMWSVLPETNPERLMKP
jgi:hypothetical protein